MVSQIVGVIGGFMQYFSYLSNSYWVLPIGRLITGWQCGIGAQIAPMYVSEFSPFKIRGVLVTVHQLMITFGIVVASLYGLDSIFGNINIFTVYSVQFTHRKRCMIRMENCDSEPTDNYGTVKF
ncbi:hypothetical protein A3Q56_03613 [Intoshia linei]|uniref:Major facilitator superfamily (MFS) profile domain-containing protein n=1 Tax=Intoshia linei TaxID=1819745 RepID=A0A177B392_9BILA|nr:hypothetical protein A3Q56_03613 [Intoshia linei]